MILDLEPGCYACVYNSTSGRIVSLALHCTHEVETVTSVVVPMQTDISFVWLLCTIRYHVHARCHYEKYL